MQPIIKADLYRHGGLSGFSGLLKGLRKPGFRYMYLLRKTAASGKFSPSGLFFRLMKRRYGYKYGFQILPKTSIGEGFYIGHFGTIIINENAVIGKNCNISPGVTIGETNRGSKKGVPVIGDKVWMGTNCVIVGNIKIGTNVLIAPNAFVNFDVPDNSLVIGNPAEVFPKENATEGYIENIRNE
ncbi:serine O-acetyltransferase [Flavobacterium sp. 3HN19-14]|uniref:serine O-acetyltransferase n=1 Tax=Flavobacterium sp. 3HN19-14 TaxID=3448133 RepID=UPI003EDEC310